MSVAWDSEAGAPGGAPVDARDADVTPDSPSSERSPGEEQPGDSVDRLGEYLIRRLVGEGGMGKVYEAEERLSKRRVALKVLREELAKSERSRGLFLNEMQILAHLEHPNIVRSLASVEADGKLCMVLEFLEGRTLRDVLNDRERIGWEEAARIVVAVARALAAAHGQEPPVIHRDLKPENIMILDDGGVKVMDFGIAKLVQELNQTNTQSVGTLQYMSPEQIDAQSIDHRTDLYCLGLVFYELLAGHPPFQSSSPRRLLNMQCTESPPPLDEALRSGVPKGIERALFGLLEKAPEDRPSSADEVVETLEMFLPEQSLRPAGDVRSASSSKASRASRPNGGEEPGSGPPNDTLPSAREGASHRDETSRRRDSHQARGAAGKRSSSNREDTVALVDRASQERELSTATSLVIILTLMVAAGLATYWWRLSSGAGGTTPAAADVVEDRVDGSPEDTEDGDSGGW